ncbi:MAG: sterol desaturase family protein, partial [Gammaproteobacteria bacterium]
MSFYDFVLENEKPIRLSFFVGMLLVMAIWEIIAPRRALTVSKAVRWVNNLGLVFFNSFIVRFLFPTAAVGVAVMAAENQWGLFNLIDMPIWFTVLASVVIMDFVIYLQHVMVHAVPV